MSEITLRVPQARVLQALMPTDPASDLIEWPVYTRVSLANTCGVSPLSDSIWRALYGLRARTDRPEMSGVVQLGLVEAIVLDIEGVKENNYRITPDGIKALTAFLKTGTIPPLKDRQGCLNKRYMKNVE